MGIESNLEHCKAIFDGGDFKHCNTLNLLFILPDIGHKHNYQKWSNVMRQAPKLGRRDCDNCIARPLRKSLPFLLNCCHEVRSQKGEVEVRYTSLPYWSSEVA